MNKAVMVPALKDVIVPILGALVPFGPTLYERATEPEIQFVYGVIFEKNPEARIAQLADKFGHLVGEDKSFFGEFRRMYLEALNVKPFDVRSATVLNLTSHELRNLRFFFSGCVGIHSYTTFPEPAAADQRIEEGRDPLIVKYDRMVATNSDQPGYTGSTATVWAKDASSCSVAVTAELPNGKQAIGQAVADLNAYVGEVFTQRQAREKKFDLALKGLLSILIAYLLFKVRKL